MNSLYLKHNSFRVVNRIDHFAQPLSLDQISSLLNDDLMFESASLSDVVLTQFYGLDTLQSLMLEAITSSKSRIKATVAGFARALNEQLSGVGIISEYRSVEISKARKSGAFAVIAGRIPLSDGQSVSIIFHTPDQDPLVINDSDTLIAFRFLLNSRDITHTVAPRGGNDVSLKQATMAIASIVSRTSEKFKAKQAVNSGYKEEIKESIRISEESETELAAMSDQIAQIDADINSDGADIKRLQSRIDKQNILQDKLQSEIDSLKSNNSLPATHNDKINSQQNHLDSLIGRAWESLDGKATVVQVNHDQAKVGIRYENSKFATIIDASSLDDHIELDSHRLQSKLDSDLDEAEKINQDKINYEMINPRLDEYLSSLPHANVQIANIRKSLESKIITSNGTQSYASLVSDYVANGYVIDNVKPAKARWFKKSGKSFIDGLTKTALDFAKWQGINTAPGANNSSETNNSKQTKDRNVTLDIQVPFVDEVIKTKATNNSLADFQQWALSEKEINAADAEELYNQSHEVISLEYQKAFLDEPRSKAFIQILNALQESSIANSVNFTVEPSRLLIQANNGLHNFKISRPYISDNSDGTKRASIDIDNTEDHTSAKASIFVDIDSNGTLSPTAINTIVNTFVELFESTKSDVVDISNLPTVGSKSDTEGTPKEIAKLVREAIKGAIKAGKLPKLKTSVRVSNHSSINIDISDLPDNIQLYSNDYLALQKQYGKDEVPRDDLNRVKTYTAEAEAIHRFIKAELLQYYCNESDSYTDYHSSRFYYTVDYDYDFKNLRRDNEIANFTGTKDEYQTIDISTKPDAPTGMTQAEIDSAAQTAATSPSNNSKEPTQAQKEAGNYKQGHVDYQGIDIAIENPTGSTRSGTDKDGTEWSITMKNHYGRIKKTKGADGEEVDVFLGNNADSENVFVIDQIEPSTGEFDEHKVMLGFNTEAEAEFAYKSNYDPEWKGLAGITEMSITDFKSWLESGNTKTALSLPQPEAQSVDHFASPEIATQYTKLAGLERMQDQMKKVNALIRKHKGQMTPALQEGLEALGLNESAIHSVMNPNYMGDVGYPKWQLSNNNATIRNTKARIKELEERAAQRIELESFGSDPTWDIAVDDATITVTENYDEDRIQVDLNTGGRPTPGSTEERIMQKLKGAFKWSPRNQVWQRKITANAKRDTAWALDFNNWDDMKNSVKPETSNDALDQELDTQDTHELDKAIQVIQNIIDNPITDFSEATERLLEAGTVIENMDKLDEYDPLIMQAAMKLQEIEADNQ